MRIKEFAIVLLMICSTLWAFTAGNGTQENPYQISTQADLEAVNNNLAASYILMNDIDLSGETYTKAVIAPDTSEEDSFQGTSFTGTFIGNGHIIRKLKITAFLKGYIGLFGQMDDGGAVSNLGIVDCDISGGKFIGGLCGYNYSGTITSSYATGVVTGTGSAVGGLCGSNFLGTITSSYATSTVIGSNNVGGLCGFNYGIITSSYATGAVTGSRAGGLCGANYFSTITSSYATGAVVGGEYVGGLCGYNYSGIITSSYAIGAVVDGEYIGGLCGYNSGTITSSFWDTQTSGQSVGIGYGFTTGIIGKATDEMKTISIFRNAGWDFAEEETDGIHEFWYIGASGYPELYVFSESYQKHIFQGFGTSQSPYFVYDKYDLVAVNQNIIADYILMNDIDLSGEVFDSVPVIFSLNGGFNGNGFAIKNLTISGKSHHVGLFGRIGSGSAVTNIGIVDCDISGERYAGGLCGLNYSGTITLSYATGVVSGNYYVGGLCGRNYGTITSSYATVDVTGERGAVGGSSPAGILSKRLSQRLRPSTT